MGTTSDKLTYLNTTKTKIKDAINLANTNITNETFRQYESKIKQALINTMNDKWGVWDNFEKVIGTGETLILNNTAEAPMKIDLKGNTSQYTTTGANVLESIATSNTTNIYEDVLWAEGLQANTTYTFQFVGVVGNRISGNANLFTTDTYHNITSGINTMTLTTKSDISTSTGSQYTSGKGWRIFKNAKSDNVVNVFTDVMANVGSTALPYEPYTNGESPNPTYPQPVNVVTGDNTIEICGKNLINTIAYNKMVNTSGAILVPGTPTNYLSINDYVSVKPNTTYTISFEKEDGGKLLIGTKDQNGEFIERTDLGVTRAFTTGNNVYQAFLYLYKANGSYTEGGWVQLEKGNAISPYEPYTSQTYPIYLGVENLLKYPYRDTTKEENGITFTDIGDGTIKVNGTASANTYFYLTTNNDDTYKKYNGKKLTISGCPSGGGNNTYLIGFFNDNFSVGTADNGNGGTFTGGDVRYNQAYIRINSGVQCDNLIFKPQLEFGTKKNSYTPYGTTPIELCKIGDYQDYIYKDNGSWYIHKEIGKVVLNGTQNISVSNWRASETSVGWLYPYNVANNLVPSTDKQLGLVISDKLKEQQTYDLYYNNVDNGISFINSDNYSFVIRTSDTTLTNNTAINNYLSSNPITAYYVLATPTNTIITDTTLISQLEALKGAMSYKGQTNIMQVPYDKPFIITASALKAI